MLALSAALALSAIHVLGGRLRGLAVVPRSWVLSAGSGVAVAYVFVHLLPEVAALEERVGPDIVPWLVALLGLVAFYGLELLARGTGLPTDGTAAGWIHLGAYTLYNAIVGYLLVERAHLGASELWPFALAMGLHLLVNDQGLRAHHAELYHRAGRWLVAAGVVGGTTLALLLDPSGLVLELLLAFLAGGIVMNVLKEELPEGRASRWLPFALAVVAYTVLLLVV